MRRLWHRNVAAHSCRLLCLKLTQLLARNAQLLSRGKAHIEEWASLAVRWLSLIRNTLLRQCNMDFERQTGEPTPEEAETSIKLSSFASSSSESSSEGFFTALKMKPFRMPVSTGSRFEPVSTRIDVQTLPDHDGPCGSMGQPIDKVLV